MDKDHQGSLEFVIQRHAPSQGPPHWDLMLQQGQTLATWQVPAPPENWSEKTILCRKIPDHRLAYLTYQGPLTQNRGHVHIVAKGLYQIEHSQSDRWHLHLHSDSIQGRLTLTKQEQDHWQLTFTPEAY